MSDSRKRRPLTQKERDGLMAMLQTAHELRQVFVSLQQLGWSPPHDLRSWDTGAEVLRALATDTHLLVWASRCPYCGGRKLSANPTCRYCADLPPLEPWRRVPVFRPALRSRAGKV